MADIRPGDNPAEAAAEPLLTLAEAAAVTGRKPEALRAMVRTGKIRAQKGNDGRLLLAIPAHMRRPQPGPEPDPSRAEADPSRIVALEAAVEEWRAAAEDARLRAAVAEAERDAARGLAATETGLLKAELERERARADRLEAELRRPWWRKLLGGPAWVDRPLAPVGPKS